MRRIIKVSNVECSYLNYFFLCFFDVVNVCGKYEWVCVRYETLNSVLLSGLVSFFAVSGRWSVSLGRILIRSSFFSILNQREKRAHEQIYFFRCEHDEYAYKKIDTHGNQFKFVCIRHPIIFLWVSLSSFFRIQR